MFGRLKNSEKSFPHLSIEQCLAKTVQQPDGSVLQGRKIFDHCQIVGKVAKEILSRMPVWILNDLFPDGSDLIAACHDIGKISPTFQRKIHEALSFKDDAILSGLNSFDPDLEKQWGGHAGVSQLTADTQDIGPWIPKILGQHHGFSPNISIYRGNDDVFGGEPWFSLRIEFVSRLKEALGTDFPLVKNALQTRILSGLTTVSDWIGSGSFFMDPKDVNWQTKIPDALDCAGFIHPEFTPGLSFENIFGFSPKDPQTRFFKTVKEHGVYILEAPMGSGKTEAALYASYRMLEKKQATGLYFALPTQLTSNKIHDRVNAFLGKVLSESSPHRKALLLHGNAWLKEKEIGEEGSPGRSWFDQGKRGILAPFAVGTIDQALMAVMNVKHGFVRAFGLAGKVVILDEVHSYDSFTGTLLDALVKDLRSLHCTVIILSATLTKKRRSKLIEVESRQEAYPLITAQARVGSFLEIVPDKESDSLVEIAHRSESDTTEEALKRAEDGQQVLWIENSVKDAQKVFRKLSARGRESGIACGLLHSRFTKADRSANEDKWVHFYGKGNPDERSQQGRILVGTQVLEQSLDIDADFLVTQIAPTDMLLQRIGRLWRHRETNRSSSAKRETWILSPELDSVMDSPEGFGRTAKVYAPYVLCRTLMVWQDLLRISIPGDVRKLIEETYSDRQDENEAMTRYFQQVIKKREDLQRLALLGLSTEGKTQSDENAMTRYNTVEEVDVLLLRSCHQDASRQLTIVRLLDGSGVSVPFYGSSVSFQERRNITIRLMQYTLRAPVYSAPIMGRRPDWLKDYFYLGDHEESLLRVGLVSDDGEVWSVDHRKANDRYEIRYDDIIGYQITKR